MKYKLIKLYIHSSSGDTRAQGATDTQMQRHYFHNNFQLFRFGTPCSLIEVQEIFHKEPDGGGDSLPPESLPITRSRITDAQFRRGSLKHHFSFMKIYDLFTFVLFFVF
jgi:hypothetical protein